MQKNIAVLCGLMISMSLSASDTQLKEEAVKKPISLKSRLYAWSDGALASVGAAKLAYQPLCTAAGVEVTRWLTMVTPAILQRLALSAGGSASKLYAAIPVVPGLVAKAAGLMVYAPSASVCMLGGAALLFAGKVVLDADTLCTKAAKQKELLRIKLALIRPCVIKNAKAMAKPAAISAAVILGLGLLGSVNKSLTIA